jgi:hypothetical protein
MKRGWGQSGTDRTGRDGSSSLLLRQSTRGLMRLVVLALTNALLYYFFMRSHETPVNDFAHVCILKQRTLKNSAAIAPLIAKCAHVCTHTHTHTHTRARVYMHAQTQKHTCPNGWPRSSLEGCLHGQVLGPGHVDLLDVVRALHRRQAGVVAAAGRAQQQGPAAVARMGW